MNEKVVEKLKELREKVYIPVFFHKLASYGIVPQTQAEANALVELGDRMLQLALQGVIMTPEEQQAASSPYVAAKTALDSLVAASAPQPEPNQSVKTAADIIEDDSIKAAWELANELINEKKAE